MNTQQKSPERLPKGKKQQSATPTLKAVEGGYLTRVRRRKVYVLRLKGYTIREMAAELKTGLHQIVEDLRAIDGALEKNIDTSQATRILNEILLEWEALKIMAIEGAKDSRGNERIGYLNTAAKINELQAKLLQDAGIICRVAARHELTGKDGAPLPAAAPIAAEIIVSTYLPKDRPASKFKLVRLQPAETKK